MLVTLVRVDCVRVRSRSTVAAFHVGGAGTHGAGAYSTGDVRGSLYWWRSTSGGREQKMDAGREGGGGGVGVCEAGAATSQSCGMEERKECMALVDKTGASVAVVRDDAHYAYVEKLVESGAEVGHSYFVPAPNEDNTLIFFHTEVDDAYQGRGLAGVLVRAVLDDLIARGTTIVPSCPLFAAHLKKHGAEFDAAGGKRRAVTMADIQYLQQVLGA